MPIETTRTPDGILVRRTTATSDMAYLKHFDGSWTLRVGDHWRPLNAIYVPAYALRAIAKMAESGAIEMLPT